MSETPLGEIYIDMQLRFDPKTQEATLLALKTHTKKISEKIEKVMEEATAKGISKGAKKSADKIGRHGFSGGGFGLFTPWNPKVMTAYFSARYMHMWMNMMFKALDEAVISYFTKYKSALNKESTSSVQDTFKNIQDVRNIIPMMPTKNILYLEEVTKGTGLKATDIASELKKMIDSKVATDSKDAITKYLNMLQYNENGRTAILEKFGGSSGIANQFMNANVTKNLIDLLSGDEFEKYANKFEKILERSNQITENKLLDRAKLINSLSLDYSLAIMGRNMNKDEAERVARVKNALSLPAVSAKQIEEWNEFYKNYAKNNPTRRNKKDIQLDEDGMLYSLLKGLNHLLSSIVSMMTKGELEDAFTIKD